jgi:hypothetical protein
VSSSSPSSNLFAVFGRGEGVFTRILACNRARSMEKWVLSAASRQTEEIKKYHGTIRNMIVASSNVRSLSPKEDTQRVYSVGLILASARTNKRHHHHRSTPYSTGTENIYSQHLTTNPLTNMRSIDLAASGAPQQARSSSPALVWLA